MIKDSSAFLNGSLEKLVHTLKVSKHKFEILSQFSNSAEEKELLMGKMAYPYDWATSMEKLQNQCSLPTRQDFYNRLTDSHVSEEAYENAEKIWSVYKCRNMLDFSMVYVNTDVVLLAEVYCNFREKIFQQYAIDCGHYLSLPQLSKDIFLKSTKAEIEYISDIDMIEFFQRGIRGGMSYIGLRHSNMEDEEEKDNLLLYVDGKFNYACKTLINFNFFYTCFSE